MSLEGLEPGLGAAVGVGGGLREVSELPRKAPIPHQDIMKGEPADGALREPAFSALRAVRRDGQ